MPSADDRNGLPGLEERTADVKDVRLRYYVGGDGPPLILVHGLAGAAANWVELVPLLGERFRLLVPDLPGHGGSGPLPAAGSLNAYADRLARLAALEQMERATIVGHSLGGVVALRMTLNVPSQVKAVVLTASAGIRSARPEAERVLALAAFLQPSRRYSRNRSMIARSPLLRNLVFGYFGASDPTALPDRAVDGFLAGLGAHSDTASARRALVRDDPRLDLEQVPCPVFLVWGARDHQVPVADAFEYARRLRAPLRVVADCGHLLIGERPDALADAIGSFLDGVR